MNIRSIRYCVLTADLIWVFAAIGLAIGLRYANTTEGFAFIKHLHAYFVMALLTAVVWALLYFEMRLDGFKGGWYFPAIISKAIVAVSLLMVVVLAFAFLTQHNYSRLVLLYFAVFFWLGVVGVRCLIRRVVTSRLTRLADRRAVILGYGPVARELANKIAAHPELSLRVIGYLSPGNSEAFNGFASSFGTSVASMKTLQVLELLTRERIHALIVAIPEPNMPEVRRLIAECRKTSLRVYLVPQWYDLYVSKAELQEIDGLPLLSLREPRPSSVRLGVKRAMDCLLSGAMLILVSPILVVSALVVHSRKGRAFRAELRCGKDGIAFPMYRLNVDRYPTNAARYERLLLRWSVTELPQLWNVLLGDMSLVGPRPESADRLKQYSDWQKQRLKVRGGVTGLAQVHGLRDRHSSEDKARFDLQYIFDWSPLWDLSLILQTVWTLLRRGLRQEPPASQKTLRTRASGHVVGEVFDANRS